MRPGAWSPALEIHLSCTMALFWDARAPPPSPGSKIRAAVPELVLGPLLRYVGPTDATVWLETSSPCEVQASVGNFSYRTSTFRVGDHHYALVRITDLEPGSPYQYETHSQRNKRVGLGRGYADFRQLHTSKDLGEKDVQQHSLTTTSVGRNRGYLNAVGALVPQ